MKSKNELRIYYKSLREHMTEKARLDDEIFKLLINSDIYNRHDVIYTYVSSEIEVDTRHLISYSLNVGKKVAVPKCDTQNCSMEFYLIQSIDELSVGAYGILEPLEASCEKAAFENALCIVPGLAFDYDGFRLGFGKGYYDRYLSSFIGETVGLCYDCCLTQKLVNDEFDRSVSALVTEKGIVRFTQGE